MNPPPPTLRTGKLCYLEIPALDVHVSAAFDERAFGWTIRNRETDRPSFDDTTGEVSGAWVLDRAPSEVVGAGILPYIMVADAASAAESVRCRRWRDRAPCRAVRNGGAGHVP